MLKLFLGWILSHKFQEAFTFAKVSEFNTTNLKEICLKLCKYLRNVDKERVVVITQGQEPVLLASNNEVIEIPVPEIPKEKIIDTNGAGDAFTGGFLAMYMQHEPLEVCVRCAIYAAGHVIQQSGCTYVGKPTFTKENI